jgi:hypothetical protein
LTFHVSYGIIRYIWILMRTMKGAARLAYGPS